MIWKDKRGGNSGVSKEGIGKSRWRRMARFRLGNKMREGYWRDIGRMKKKESVGYAKWKGRRERMYERSVGSGRREKEVDRKR